MVILFVCVGLLILGYFICESIVDRLFGVDRSRKTPAETIPDGVDYVKLSPWKIFLIQLLNIAGLWPIYGPIRGALVPSALDYFHMRENLKAHTVDPDRCKDHQMSSLLEQWNGK